MLLYLYLTRKWPPKQGAKLILLKKKYNKAFKQKDILTEDRTACLKGQLKNGPLTSKMSKRSFSILSKASKKAKSWNRYKQEADPGDHRGKWQIHKKTSHTREARGWPFPSRSILAAIFW